MGDSKYEMKELHQLLTITVIDIEILATLLIQYLENSIIGSNRSNKSNQSN